jgi:type I protein arginine methyltransferase
MYSVSNYASMIEDRIRMDAYLAALQAAITPGCVVLDIGTGTGAIAILACRAGAGRVYAVEPSDAIRIARELAVDNGCSDRIEFIQGISTTLELPCRADVVVSDLRGVLPLFGQHIPSIVDARERLLAPGGTLIPRRDHLWCALVDAPEVHTKHLRNAEACPYGVDMRRVHSALSHTWRKAVVTAEQLASAPQCWGTLDYGSITSPDVQGEVRLVASRSGSVHGLSLWFDAEIGEGIGFSNSPSHAQAIYGQAFFPFPRAVQVRDGDAFVVTLRAKLVDDEYLWWWRLVSDGPGAEPDRVRFDQSTFFALPLDPRQLAKGERSFVPTGGPVAAVDRFILERMEGRQSLGEISDAALEAFPGFFSSPSQALAHVGDLSRRYSA